MIASRAAVISQRPLYSSYYFATTTVSLIVNPIVCGARAKRQLEWPFDRTRAAHFGIEGECAWGWYNAVASGTFRHFDCSSA
jgi:hypothetical protein